MSEPVEKCASSYQHRQRRGCNNAVKTFVRAPLFQYSIRERRFVLNSRCFAIQSISMARGVHDLGNIFEAVLTVRYIHLGSTEPLPKVVEG